MTDYDAYDVPDDKPREEYTYNERRAELLERIREAGHPEHLNQTELGDEYGVHQSQISRDFKALREFIRDSLGTHRHTITDSVYRKAVREYVAEGEYNEAIDALESWNEWLREEGARDVEPETERREIEGDLLAEFE